MTKMYSVSNSAYADAVSSFNSLFDWVGDFMEGDAGNSFRLPKSSKTFSIVTDGSKFPFHNFSINKQTRDCKFEFGLAGYDKEKIEVSFHDNQLFLEVEPAKRDEPEWEVGVNGLKKSSVHSRYFVDFSKYDVGNAEAEFKDGILTVVIPAFEDQKPKKLAIK